MPGVHITLGADKGCDAGEFIGAISSIGRVTMSSNQCSYASGFQEVRLADDKFLVVVMHGLTKIDHPGDKWAH